MKIRDICFSAALVAAAGCLTAPETNAQSVGADVFINPYSDWVDPRPDLEALWRLSLHNPTLMDTNDANPPISGAVSHSGVYQADFLINDTYLAPASYTLETQAYSNDDDIMGLVWNYLDNENYFRVGIRQQAAGTFGGTQGLAVQKVVDGVLTQISPMGNGPGAPSPISQSMINNRTRFTLSVVVDSTTAPHPTYRVLFDGVEIVSGQEPDLVSDRKIGLQSWAQTEDSNNPLARWWGAEFETVRVTDSTGTLFNQSFAYGNYAWRNVVMTNGSGRKVLTAGVNRELYGSFGVDVDDPWILQDTNGFLFGSSATGPNVLDLNSDFIGPGVVIDEPGSGSWANYELKTRIGSTDNDGLGVLVRVQDDNNFYRISFAAEGLGTDPLQPRAPRGLSVQKVREGVWSELFRENQSNVQFVYTDNSFPAVDPRHTGFEAFDLSVKAIGNALYVQVTDHLGNVYNYDPIVDTDNPLLTGTAGLHTWGSPGVFFMEYGGTGSGNAFITYIPEPTTAMLAGLAGLILVGTHGRRPWFYWGCKYVDGGRTAEGLTVCCSLDLH